MGYGGSSSKSSLRDENAEKLFKQYNHDRFPSFFAIWTAINQPQNRVGVLIAAAVCES
jgi:hypothetical protein